MSSYPPSTPPPPFPRPANLNLSPSIHSAPLPSSPGGLRRHSYEALPSPSLSVSSFGLAVDGSFGSNHGDAKYIAGRAPSLSNAAVDVSFELLPAPQRPAVSRFRSASYSAPRSQSFVPNYSMPLHLSNSPAQWAFTRPSPSSLRPSFLAMEENSPELEAESPMDILPPEFDTSFIPPKPTSPLPPIPAQEDAIDRNLSTTPPPRAFSESPINTTTPLPVVRPTSFTFNDERRLSSRQLSPIALAALADMPPRPLLSTSLSFSQRPSIPPKSSARASQGSIKRDSGGSESELSAGTVLPSQLSARPISGSSSSTSAVTPTQTLPSPTILSPNTPVLGLTHPRPRQPPPHNRTPSLSQAGSSSSRASSSLFSPSSSAIARSSVHSGDGTDWARTSVSESDQGKEETHSGAEEFESLNSSSRSSRLSVRKIPVNLRLEKVDRPPPLGLGLGLGGLGIDGLEGDGLEDDDLQRGLDELARYAQSLPSPLPPSDPELEPLWRLGSKEDDEGAIMLSQMSVIEDEPVSLSRNFSRSQHPSSRQPSRASLHPHSSSGSVRRRRVSAATTIDPEESDAYLSVDESGLDEFTTDDEDGAGLVSGRRTFLDLHGGATGRRGRKSDTHYTYPGGGLPLQTVEGEVEEVLHSVTEAKYRVEDAAGRSLEGVVVGPDTTHLILTKTTTPHLVPQLLRRTVPTLTHGLSVLDISHCDLSEIPETIGACVSLRELDIKGNVLAAASLPPFIVNLVTLRVLIADSCGIDSLTTPLDPLRHLHTLSIRNNSLRSLPGWLSRLATLEVLLVDGNDFHWQWANLVVPILLHQTTHVALKGPINLSPMPSASTSEFVTYSARSSISNTAMSPISGVETPGSVHSATDLQRAQSAVSLPQEDIRVFTPPGSGPISPAPSQHSYSTPPPASAPHIDLADAQARLRHHSDQPQPSLAPSVVETSSSSNKWGKMFKKVSINKMRPSSSRPGALSEAARTFSQPITSSESTTVEHKISGGSLFRNRVLSKPTRATPAPLALGEAQRRATAKRQSFLKLEQVPPLDSMINDVDLNSQQPVDHKAGLRSVMAYLRDLDDLSFEHLAPATPSLRTSPSLGSMNRSPSTPGVAIRRAQSSRRLPPRARSRADSAMSQFIDDDGNGRTTPLANRVPSVPKLRADPIRRSAVINEIVQTEQSYLKGLQELCDIYITAAAIPVSSSSGKKDTVVPILERRAVFGNVEGIRVFHEGTFLPQLQEATRVVPGVSSAGESTIQAERVAKVFIEHVAFLKIYSSYVNAFDTALTRLQTWTAESGTSRPGTASSMNRGSFSSEAAKLAFDPAATSNPALSTSQKKRIKSYLKRCRTNPRHSQISLESYLLLPVQRVPRYRMLLESLLSCTPAQDFGDSAILEPHPVIEQALELIGDVATDMNERKRESEGRQQLLIWQTRIGNNFRSPLVQPHRSLVRCGTFTLVRTVKRASTYVETPWVPRRSPTPSSDSSKVLQVHSLHTDTVEQRLIALLCTDIIVFVKEPADQQDPMAPVDLYTVLRLSHGPKERPPPATLFGNDNMLRITCDSRAILYVRCDRRSEAISWCNAINLQKGLNS